MATDTTWVILSQAPDQYDPDNPANPTAGVIVTFTTGDGNTGSVFIPKNQYTVATVHARVSAEASKVDDIGRLTHESMPGQ